MFFTKKEEVVCLSCGIRFKRGAAEIARRSNHFCNNSCAATYTNKIRNICKGKTKQIHCSKCNGFVKVSVHAKNISKCLNCRKISRKDNVRILKLKKRNLKEHNVCSVCKVITRGSGKFCDSCRRAHLSLKRIAAIQNGKTNFSSIKCKFNFNNNKIQCDSKLEYCCLYYFTQTFKVINISRAQIIIPYRWKGMSKNFLPDFDINTTNGRYIVECKGDIGHASLNKKWHFYNETAVLKKQALKTWCQQNNIKHYWFAKKDHNKLYCKIKLSD